MGGRIKDMGGPEGGGASAGFVLTWVDADDSPVANTAVTAK
jgi:hypothetical protein